MKISEYKLISEYSENNLNEAVNELIAKGWQPYGSPSNSYNRDSFNSDTMAMNFIQAMVKYE